MNLLRRSRVGIRLALGINARADVVVATGTNGLFQGCLHTARFQEMEDRVDEAIGIDV